MFLKLEQVTGRNRNLHVRIQLIDDGKDSRSWNMLQQDFKTLERTLEVETGWSTVPCCWNRMMCVGTGLLHVGTEFLKM